MQNPEQTYRIIRFFQDDTPSKVIETGLTRKEAQAHCQDPESEGDGWFDGFQSETDKYTCGCPSSVGYVTEETHPDGTPEETPVCNGCGSEIEL